MFDLDHVFWKAFYHRMAMQQHQDIPKKKEDDETHSSKSPSSNISIYLLSIDALTVSMPLSAFQSEMLEQSLMAMYKGFYNVEQKGIVHQKKLFKDALSYAKDIPLVAYDRWINQYAQVILNPKI